MPDNRVITSKLIDWVELDYVYKYLKSAHSINKF